MVNKLLEVFSAKELLKTNQDEFKIEKVIKRKGNKLYVKWKVYDNSFNSWIDEKDIVWKRVNTFLKHIKLLEEILISQLIYLITQQKQT